MNFVPRSGFAWVGRVLVGSTLLLVAGSLLLHAPTVGKEPTNAVQEEDTEPFRPEAGKFPPLEQALSYRGELIFVDHANRRGSIRVQGSGMFFRNDPHPFAMLPYGMVRYHNAPADLRDVPLGTVMHAKAFLPPDPRISAVPVLPIDNRTRDGNHNRGAGIFPAENHVLLLEDEPSHCRREGLVWKLQEIDIRNNAGMIVASLEAEDGSEVLIGDENMTFDAGTRIWVGRELLGIDEWVAEEICRAKASTHSAVSRSCWGSLGNRPPTVFLLGFISRTFGSMTPPWNERLIDRRKRTRRSFAAAGCRPGSMRWNTASLDKRW
ncbi:MAG: hypothetical protein R3B96_02780 [Pirellulaceae bacterium]